MICFTVPFRPNSQTTDYAPPVFGEEAASFYGKPIPISTGTRRLVGACIWSSNIRTYRNSLGDLKSKSPEYVTDQTIDPGPFADFAMAFGYRASESSNVPTNIKITRIWANGILIFDRKIDFAKVYTGSEEEVETQLFPVDFTIYSGTETQDPDPTIIAEEGIQNTPGFRGMVYIVFKDFPLAKVGTGAIPTIKVELADKASGFNTIAKFQKTAPDITNNFVPISVANWPKRKFTIWTNTEAVTYNMDTLKEVSRSPLSPELVNIRIANEAYTFVVNDKIYTAVTRGDSAISRPVYLVDFENGIFITRLGADSGSVPGGQTAVDYSLGFNNALLVNTYISWRDGSPIYRKYLLMSGGIFGADSLIIAFFDPYNDTLKFVFGDGGDNVLGFGRIRGLAAGKPLSEISNYVDVMPFWVAADSYLLKAFLPYKTYEGQNPTFSEWFDFNTIDPAFTWEVIAIVRDPNDGNMICWVNKGGTKLVIKIRTGDNLIYNGAGTVVIDDDDKVMWTVSSTTGFNIIIQPAPSQINNMIFRGSQVSYSSSRWTTTLDTIIGKAHTFLKDFVTDINGDGQVTSGCPDGQMISDCLADTLIVCDSRGGTFADDIEYSPAKIYYDQAQTDRVPLRNLLLWYCRAAGYSDSDIVIDSSITDSITGSIINTRVSLSDLFNQLKVVFGFDKYESGGKIKIKRIAPGETYAYDFTVPDGMLAPLDGEGGTNFLHTELQEPDQIAAGIEIKYLDEDADYAINVQRANRRKYPVPTTTSDQYQSYSVPIIMTSGEALSYANNALWQLQSESLMQNFRVDWSYLQAEPSTVWGLYQQDRFYTIKSFEVMINADFTLSIGAKTLSLVVDRTYEADDPIRTPASIALIKRSVPIIMDVSIIGDGVIPDIPEKLIYGLSAGPDSVVGPWPAVNVYRSLPQSPVAATVSRPPTRGTVQGVLPSPGDAGDDTIKFKLYNGVSTEFATQTFEQAVAGEQMIAVGAPGRWELMAAQTVDYDATTKVVTLGGLVRSLKATDDASVLHRGGDEIVLYNQADYAIMAFDTSEYGNVHTYRAARSRDTLADAVSVSYLLKGTNVTPVGPGALMASYAGSDVLLTWKRRDRRNFNDFEDLTDDVVNSEGFEKYKLEIINDSGVVVRTLDALTVSSYTYLSADIIADLGSIPTKIRIRVYQAGSVIPFGNATDQVLDIYHVV